MQFLINRFRPHQHKEKEVVVEENQQEEYHRKHRKNNLKFFPGSITRRLAIIGLIFLVPIIYRYTALSHFVSVDWFVREKSTVIGWINNNYWISYLLYIGVISFFNMFCIPGGQLLYFAAGIIYGPIIGSFLCTIGIAVGATGCYFLESRALTFNELTPTWRKGLEFATSLLGGKHQSPLYYMVNVALLRNIPFIPTYIVNLLPLYYDLPGIVYFIGVLMGTIPYSYFMNISGDIMIDIFQYRNISPGHKFSWRYDLYRYAAHELSVMKVITAAAFYLFWTVGLLILRTALHHKVLVVHKE